MKLEITDRLLQFIFFSLLAGLLFLGLLGGYKLKMDYDYLESEVAFKRQAVKEAIETGGKNGVRKF